MYDPIRKNYDSIFQSAFNKEFERSLISVTFTQNQLLRVNRCSSPFRKRTGVQASLKKELVFKFFLERELMFFLKKEPMFKFLLGKELVFKFLLEKELVFMFFWGNRAGVQVSFERNWRSSSFWKKTGDQVLLGKKICVQVPLGKSVSLRSYIDKRKK
jgi:hypothetical protein